MTTRSSRRGVPTPVAVPICGTPARGRLGFVVGELGSVWRELRDRRRARSIAGGEG